MDQCARATAEKLSRCSRQFKKTLRLTLQRLGSVRGGGEGSLLAIDSLVALHVAKLISYLFVQHVGMHRLCIVYPFLSAGSTL